MDRDSYIDEWMDRQKCLFFYYDGADMYLLPSFNQTVRIA